MPLTLMLAVLETPVIAAVFCVARERMCSKDGFNKVIEKTENDMRNDMCDDMLKRALGCPRAIKFSDQTHP